MRWAGGFLTGLHQPTALPQRAIFYEPASDLVYGNSSQTNF